MQDKLIILTDKKQQNANTDNKINRFVTFFALTFCYLDSFVRQDKSGPRTCFL
jgi:hypothetical protein